MRSALFTNIIDWGTKFLDVFWMVSPDGYSILKKASHTEPCTGKIGQGTLFRIVVFRPGLA